MRKKYRRFRSSWTVVQNQKKKFFPRIVANSSRTTFVRPEHYVFCESTKLLKKKIFFFENLFNDHVSHPTRSRPSRTRVDSGRLFRLRFAFSSLEPTISTAVDHGIIIFMDHWYGHDGRWMRNPKAFRTSGLVGLRYLRAPRTFQAHTHTSSQEFFFLSFIDRTTLSYVSAVFRIKYDFIVSKGRSTVARTNGNVDRVYVFVVDETNKLSPDAVWREKKKTIVTLTRMHVWWKFFSRIY